MNLAMPCLAIAVALCLPAAFGSAQQPDDKDAFAQQRRKLAHRTRRIILNNDGCDVLYFPKGRDVTPEDLLDLRTSPLVGSHVDTVFYCTISSGFSHFTHNTRVGEVLRRNVGEELNVSGKVNITDALIAQGTDSLRIMVEFCHENNMEIFWSMRMNDTHDGAHRPEKPYPLFPTLKYEHPEYLIGSLDNRPKHGAWTSVDYTLPEIRDLAFKFIEEVCQNYGIDGVELDFFRHLSYFKTVALGGVATQKELDMMTDLLRRVRTMADAEGRKRGRPILIAVRVPDSVDYCRGLGFDLERWLREGLIDLLIGGGYFQMNPWEYLVELGHNYGVTVYPGLSESRVRGESPRFRRNSAESYRARAARVWQAGAGGVYLFNYFNPRSQFLREIGDPEALRSLDKVYFATVRNGNPNSYLTDGKQFRTVPILTPSDPIALTVGERCEIDVLVGDDLALAAPDGAPAKVTCHLLALGADHMAVKLNGTRLESPKASDEWWDYVVEPDLVRPGANRFEFANVQPQRDAAEEPSWTVAWMATEKPKAPWSCDRPRKNTRAEISNGALLIADQGTEGGDYLYYAYPWNVSPAEEAVVEARAKVVSGWSNIIISNGVAIERICLYPDRISTYHSKITHEMDTTDDFHTYRIVTKGEDLRVYVDGELRLDASGMYTAPTPGGRNNVSFGAANSPSTGEAYWESVRFRTLGASLYDLVLSIRFAKGKD